MEFFGNSMDRIGHEHFLATVDFKLSYLVGPRTKFRVLALSVQNANKMFNVRSKYVILPTSPNKNGEEQVWFPSSIALLCKKCSKHCDWNQAPGCQRETPQIEGKTPQIEEKSSFRFNCLTLSRQAKILINKTRRDLQTITPPQTYV